jgi:hypothetical protein
MDETYFVAEALLQAFETLSRVGEMINALSF